MKKISKMLSSKIIFILVFIFILVSYFIWVNKLESYTEKQRVDYPGNDMLYKAKDLDVPECITECKNTIGCKGIVTNFKEGTYDQYKRYFNPKCWLKDTIQGNGNINRNDRYTYIL